MVSDQVLFVLICVPSRFKSRRFHVALVVDSRLKVKFVFACFPVRLRAKETLCDASGDQQPYCLPCSQRYGFAS